MAGHEADDVSNCESPESEDFATSVGIDLTNSMENFYRRDRPFDLAQLTDEVRRIRHSAATEVLSEILGRFKVIHSSKHRPFMSGPMRLETLPVRLDQARH